MIRKTITISFSIPLAIPRAIVYYAPFCPRPSITVTSEVLDKLRPCDPDAPLHEVRQKVAQQLACRFGDSLVTPSPHLLIGAGVRSLLCSSIWLPLCAIDPVFAALAWLMHNSCYMIVMTIELCDQATLCAKYMALCGE